MKRKNFAASLLPLNIANFLFQEERRSGLLLILAAVTAHFLANSAWSGSYFAFLNQQFTLGAITLDLQHWVSEGLMAIFFIVVVLEVKREFIDGELSTWRKASFPLIAAAGGMLVPAFIYSFFNSVSPQSTGWAIPIATDIAIAIGVLALLGKRIPKNLRIFLLALAIIDDIGSIIVIAIFYSQPTNVTAFLSAAVLCLALVFVRKQRLWLPGFVLIGFGLWYCLLLAGISGTMAGVIVAALAPLSTRDKRRKSLQSSERIEDILLPLTAYFIVPLFVFVSAGLEFGSLSLTRGNGLMVFVGVACGLLIGKPLGIISASWLSAQLRLASKPASLTWTHILGAGFIAGIGFTISLLVADLSFGDYPMLQNAAVLGIFLASIISGLMGLVILGLFSNKKTT